MSSSELGERPEGTSTDGEKDISYRSDLEQQDEEKDATKDALDAEEPTERDPNIVDWDGPDDPANPMNWALSKKVIGIGIVSFITFLSPLSSTMISPATADVMRTFHSTNETLGAFVTSVYLLGYAFGPLIIAPLSEMYGRAPVYNTCNLIFLIFSIACAVANSLGSLIVFRLLAGIGASCAVTIGAGSIADMIPLERRGLAMALWIMGPLLGPTTGPLAGGYLAAAKSWRWIFWVISIVGGAALVLTAVFLRETNGFVILQHKTKRLRKETGNPNLRSALDTGRTPKQLMRVSIVRPLKMLVLSPIVFIISLYMAIVYGYLYLMFTTFPRIFEGQYHFSQSSVGLVYMGTGVGSFFGLIFVGAISDRLVTGLTKRYGGKPKPEYRLPAMFIGCIAVPVGLFLYGWTAEKKTHWMAPIIGEGLVGLGLFLTFMPGMSYLVDAFTIYAASVSAASTVIRSLLGALLPLAGDSMYNALGVGWGTSLLGFIAVAFLPMPLILWTYGERIRQSKFSQANQAKF